MTAPARNGCHRSPFGEWLRSNPELDSVRAGLSIIDIDWCIHRFHSRPCGRAIQNFMFIEEKQFGKPVGQAQKDTLFSIYQFFDGHKNEPKLKRVWSTYLQAWVTLRFWGIHKLTFSHAGPSDSDWISWDGTKISEQALEGLLRFEISPFSLMPRDERLHHGGAQQKPFPFARAHSME